MTNGAERANRRAHLDHRAVELACMNSESLWPATVPVSFVANVGERRCSCGALVLEQNTTYLLQVCDELSHLLVASLWISTQNG